MRREPQADQYHRNHRRRLGTTSYTYPASGPDMLGIWFLVSLRTEYLPAEVTSIVMVPSRRVVMTLRMG